MSFADLNHPDKWIRDKAEKEFGYLAAKRIYRIEDNDDDTKTYTYLSTDSGRTSAMNEGIMMFNKSKNLEMLYDNRDHSNDKFKHLNLYISKF